MNLDIVFAAFFAIGTASAQAQGQGPLRSRALQTPDGTPPAFEGACDEYKDEEEPYGICVALCEAQDCDVDSSTTSCEALKTNWLKITGGEELPCKLATPSPTTTPTGTPTSGPAAPGPPPGTCNFSCCTNSGCLDITQTGCSQNGCGKTGICWALAAVQCLPKGGATRLFDGSPDAVASKSPNYGSFQGNKSCQELADENSEPDGKAVCKSAPECSFTYCRDGSGKAQCAKAACAAGCFVDECTDPVTTALEEVLVSAGATKDDVTVQAVSNVDCLTALTLQDVACPVGV